MSETQITAKPPFLLVEQGAEVAYINWTSTLPQIESLVIHRLDGTRISNVRPITFAASMKEGRVVELLSCVIEYSTVPAPDRPSKTITGIGFFYRFPYEFNGEWALASQENAAENAPANDGLWKFNDAKAVNDKLPAILHRFFDVPFWPETESDSGKSWLLCVLFESGLSRATGVTTPTQSPLYLKE